MRLFLDLLGKHVQTIDDKKIALFTQKARDQATRLNKLVTELFDISRIQKSLTLQAAKRVDDHLNQPQMVEDGSVIQKHIHAQQKMIVEKLKDLVNNIHSLP